MIQCRSNTQQYTALQFSQIIIVQPSQASAETSPQADVASIFNFKQYSLNNSQQAQIEQ